MAAAAASSIRRSCASCWRYGRPPIRALTDVTGFGIRGLDLARGAGLTFRLDAAALPLLQLSGAAEPARDGFVTGASHRNRTGSGDAVDLPAAYRDRRRHLLADLQISGDLRGRRGGERPAAHARRRLPGGRPDRPDEGGCRPDSQDG